MKITFQSDGNMGYVRFGEPGFGVVKETISLSELVESDITRLKTMCEAMNADIRFDIGRDGKLHGIEFDGQAKELFFAGGRQILLMSHDSGNEADIAFPD